MATDKIQINEGTAGKYTGTYSFSEDAVTKNIGRVVLNKSDGTEIGTALNPVEVDTGLIQSLTDSQLRATPVPVSATALTTLAGVVKAEDSPSTTGDSGFPLLAMRYASDVPTTSDDGDYTLLKVDEEGRLKVATKPASYADITGDITATQPVSSTPANGTTYNVVTTASNNLASIKASAGNLYEITVSNPTATAAYVKLYNKASAPVVASDVPVMTIAIPATAAGVGEKSFNFGAVGKRFATGIAIGVVGAAAATDATNAVAGVQINATYI